MKSISKCLEECYEKCLENGDIQPEISPARCPTCHGQKRVVIVRDKQRDAEEMGVRTEPCPMCQEQPS